MINIPNLDSILNFQRPALQMPEIKSIPEMFFEDLEAHIREVEHTLDENERIAIVYNQTGEIIIVECITRRGMAFILWCHDGNGTKTNIFANIDTFQIAFKIVDVMSQEKHRPIGFMSSP